ncbi:MAG: SDR family NAD(P)-dependent oxidoreductase [Actinomycetota bacterium]
MKTALVTGATSGIGRATALALAHDGFYVLATGRDGARGRSVATELTEHGKGDFIPRDLALEGACDSLVDDVVERTGRLDVLVNNAGVHFLAPVEATDPDEFRQLLEVNVIAPALLARAAVPVMRSGGGGVIANVSSEAGIVAVPGQMAYNLSKAALIMLTKSIAVDHSDDGIRAVTICPGTTRTPLVEAAIASAQDPAAHERWLASSRPLKRLGTEQEIARVIAFVVSDQATFMTGTEIVVDGGYTAV